MQLQRRATLKALAAGPFLAAATSSDAQSLPPLDTGYSAWDALLKKHVQWLPDNKQSRVDYTGFLAERVVLQQVLAEWTAVTPAGFAAFSREQQMAFLINVYNGFTIELILSAYPKLKSIKDLGSLIQSPWKKRFFSLLGEPRHLDWIEHEQLRPRYNDPRVHAAVNCASIGCPALRPEAFTAARLGAQLDDGMLRFMADRSRNRFADGRLQVSMIFKWFREDFEQGHQGFAKLEDVMVRYADVLSGIPAERDKIRSRQAAITFLEYDWSLNDLRR